MLARIRCPEFVDRNKRLPNRVMPVSANAPYPGEVPAGLIKT